MAPDRGKESPVSDPQGTPNDTASTRSSVRQRLRESADAKQQRLDKARPAYKTGDRHERQSGFIRRRLIPWTGRISVLVGLLLLGAWLTGRILNDTRSWSQYLYWLPTGLVAIGAWGLYLTSAIAERVGTRLAGAIGRPFLLIAALGVTFWMLAIEWKSYRYLYPSPPHPQATVLFWNLAAHPAGDASDKLTDMVDQVDADILILANPQAGNQLSRLLSTAKELVELKASDPAPPESGDPDDRPNEGPEEDQDATPVGPAIRLDEARKRYLVRIGLTTIASRFPVLDTGSAGLKGVDGEWIWRPTETGVEGIEFVTLDTTEVLGKATSIWIVDLPSNPVLHREDVMRAALTAAREWKAYRSEEFVTGFPAPDIILGDFNTPAGSESLKLLVGDFNDAYREAGRGPRATFPRGLPQLAIDLAFVDPALETRLFRRLDPGVGHHCAIALGIGNSAASESSEAE